jgi:transcriptional regulator with XRE-family HTH domain
MTEFTDRLNERRKELGLTVQDVLSSLQLQGVDLTYQAVAGWFNGARGERWSPEILLAVLDLLQTDLRTLVGGEAPIQPDLSGPIYNAVAREIASLPEPQQAALLSLLRSFRG